MKRSREKPLDAAELRRRAEKRLKASKKQEVRPGTKEETRRLLHELQVHQIELEMQNEELQQARAETEAVVGQYTDLYDFAPVGYVTLHRDGTIRQANLTADGRVDHQIGYAAQTVACFGRAPDVHIKGPIGRVDVARFFA